MLVYGRNVAKELLENGEDVKKIFLQDNFDDKKIISLMEKRQAIYEQTSDLIVKTDGLQCIDVVKIIKEEIDNENIGN